MWQKSKRVKEVEPENVTELLRSHDKTLRDEEFPLTDQPRMWFFEMETAPGEDAIKIVDNKTFTILHKLSRYYSTSVRD